MTEPVVTRAADSYSIGSGGRRRKTERRNHDGSKTRVYQSWRSMIARCTLPRNKRYARYGGRGITICERWQKFVNFREDMGEAPDGLSLDRIDGDGNYEPGNCRWASPLEQARNRRTNVLITIDGETLCQAEWAHRAGVSKSTIAVRLRAGITGRALLAPTFRQAKERRQCLIQ